MTQTPWTRGHVHVYTGHGKGKTTAALGLALRAAGAGLPVLIVQFIKHGHYSELSALERLGQITVRQFGRGCFITGEPTDEDRQLAAEGVAEVRRSLAEHTHRVVILDEACAAVETGLVAVDELLSLLDERPEDVEMIVTGRNAPEALVARADLVTEMVPVKHYYNEGVQGRVGIEK